MKGYVLGQNAQRDLEEIWDYVAERNPEAADRLTRDLFEAFEALARNPGLGHQREDLTQFPVLFWPVGSYRVIYRVRLNVVEIAAVVHGKRDIPAFLGRRGAQ